MIRLPSVLLLAAFLLGGCNDGKPAGLPTTTMTIGNQTFTLEIARSGLEQEKGLMFRDVLPQGHGMIFPFDQQKVLGFWMANVRFPLDVLFVDASGKVVSIHQMKAYDKSTTSSDVPAKYAIELPKGAAEAAGVKVGDTLDIPTNARAPGG